MFGNKGFNASKLKVQLKMAVLRIEILKNKRTALLKENMREVAQMLSDRPPKEEKAMIRAEALIRDDNMIEAMEIIQLQIELLQERLKLLELSKSSSPPPKDLLPVIGTIMWSSKRIDGIPEMNTIYQQLVSKFGKTFEKSVMKNEHPMYVNERVAAKLSFQPPAAYLVQVYSEKICELFQVDWQPSHPILLDDHNNLSPMTPPQGYSVPYGNGTGLGSSNNDTPKINIFSPTSSHNPNITSISHHEATTTTTTSRSVPMPSVVDDATKSNDSFGSKNDKNSSNNNNNNNNEGGGGSGMMTFFRNRNNGGHRPMMMASTGISSHCINSNHQLFSIKKTPQQDDEDNGTKQRHHKHDCNYQDINDTTTIPTSLSYHKSNDNKNSDSSNIITKTNPTEQPSSATTTTTTSLHHPVISPTAPPSGSMSRLVRNDSESHDEMIMISHSPTTFKYCIPTMNTKITRKYHNHNNNKLDNDEHRDDENHNHSSNGDDLAINPTWDPDKSSKTLQTNHLSTSMMPYQSMEYADLASRFDQVAR